LGAQRRPLIPGPYVGVIGELRRAYAPVVTRIDEFGSAAKARSSQLRAAAVASPHTECSMITWAPRAISLRAASCADSH